MAFLRILYVQEFNQTVDGITTIRRTPRILEFDAIERWSDTLNTDITEHVIEDGSVLTDHKRRTPRQITFTGVVVQSPIGDVPYSGKINESRIRHSFQNYEEGTFLTYDEEFDRTLDVFEAMTILINNPILCTVECAHEVYNNMLVKSMEDIREGSNSTTSLRLNVSLQEVFIANTSTAAVQPVPREPRGQQEPDRSAVSTTAAGAAQTPPESWLRSQANRLDGWISR
jgi:hypothetical protein